MLVGLETGDDAGVYRLGPDLALVQTIDYFTPIVDDPYDFGRIAAANALSDIYAMGGKPLTVLNIVGFPIAKLDKQILADILRGAAATVREAGATLLGGHSIDDVDPKFGLAVTGVIHPDDIWTNVGARAGDALVLTKPIGMGIVTKAIKEAQVSEEAQAQAIHYMAQLNRAAAEVGRAYEVHAATDVTGFGLLGHALEMVRGSGLGLRLAAHSVPFLIGARDYAQRGLVPAGSKRNRAFVEPFVDFAPAVEELTRVILADAVTSGGLLFAVPGGEASAFVAAQKQAGMDQTAVIGEFTEECAGRIEVQS